MKLFYLPGACSLATHIALREVGAAFELDRLDNASKQTESGADFLAINPKGYVPALSLDSGEVLTEGVAILQYIADQNPGKNLPPAAGSLARTRLQEYLNFIATELHKSFSPLFTPGASEEAKTAAKKKVAQKLDLHRPRRLAASCRLPAAHRGARYGKVGPEGRRPGRLRQTT